MILLFQDGRPLETFESVSQCQIPSIKNNRTIFFTSVLNRDFLADDRADKPPEKIARKNTARNMPKDGASIELIKTKHAITIKISSPIRDSAYKRTYLSDSFSSFRSAPSSLAPALQRKPSSTDKTSSLLNSTTNKDSPTAPLLMLGK